MQWPVRLCRIHVTQPRNLDTVLREVFGVHSFAHNVGRRFLKKRALHFGHEGAFLPPKSGPLAEIVCYYPCQYGEIGEGSSLNTAPQVIFDYRTTYACCVNRSSAIHVLPAIYFCLAVKG
jgi:hypothetical protein